MVHPSYKEYLISCLKLCIVISAIAYLIITQKISFANPLIQRHTIHYLIAGIFCSFLGLIVSFIRYYLLIKTLQINIGLWDVFRICFIGVFFSTFMLGGVGGDIIKVAYLLQRTKDIAGAFSSAVVDRILGLTGLISLGCFAILTGLNEITSNQGLYILLFFTVGTLVFTCICFFVSIVAMNTGRKKSLIVWSIFIAVTICLLWIFKNNLLVTSTADVEFSQSAIFTNISLLIPLCGISIGSLGCILIVPSCLPGRRFDLFIRRKVPLGGKLMSMIQSILVYRNHLDALGWAYLISIVSWIFIIISLYFFSNALPLTHQPTIAQIFYTSPIPFLANIIPLPVGGIGVGESAFEYALHLCRISGGQSISGGASIFLMWRFWVIILSLLGLPLYLKSKLDLHKAILHYRGISNKK